MLEIGLESSIVTFSGQKFYFERPEGFEYTFEDIGHALSNLCRYAGQGDFWSVGQHSLLVSELCEPRDKLRGLLHDASEAFLVDVPGPLKELPFMSGYKQLEARVMRAIHKQFGLPFDSEADKRVKEIDVAVRPAEAEMIGLKWGMPNGHVAIPYWLTNSARTDVQREFVMRAKLLME